MSEDKISQSLNVSGGHLSNVQIGGQAGRDLTMNQHQQVDEGTGERLNSQDVIALIVQLETLFSESELPTPQAEKAIQHLAVAKEEIADVEPDKEFAAKNLQRATKVLKDAGETIEAGTGLWSKVEPILNELFKWLGVAVGLL